jgi:hypothetical protein
MFLHSRPCKLRTNSLQLKYLPLCSTYLPGFPITHIGFSTSYARRFLSYPNVSFNLLQKLLFVSPGGVRFIRDAHAMQRAVYAWTVNEDHMMRWCIKEGIDGVITDDPKRFLEVVDDWKNGKRNIEVSYSQWAGVAWLFVMVQVFGAIFRWKFAGGETKAEKERRKAMERRQDMSTGAHMQPRKQLSNGAPVTSKKEADRAAGPVRL